MYSATHKPMLVRLCGVVCFISALVLLLVASWLFAEGHLPTLTLGDGTHLAFGGISINGLSLPDWTFYFLPGGLYLAAVAFFFIGWRLVRRDHEKGP